MIDLGYETAMVEQHLKTEMLHTTCGYIIAQARGRGMKFNKWTKAENVKRVVDPAPVYATPVYQELTEAISVLESIDPELRPYWRIFPVVAVVGNDPVEVPRD